MTNQIRDLTIELMNERASNEEANSSRVRENLRENRRDFYSGASFLIGVALNTIFRPNSIDDLYLGSVVGIGAYMVMDNILRRYINNRVLNRSQKRLTELYKTRNDFINSNQHQ